MRTMFCGTPDTMPPKMISESPLPMPCSVIKSPNQMANIVPAVIAASTAMVDRVFSSESKPKLGKTGEVPKRLKPWACPKAVNNPRGTAR